MAAASQPERCAQEEYCQRVPDGCKEWPQSYVGHSRLGLPDARQRLGELGRTARALEQRGGSTRTERGPLLACANFGRQRMLPTMLQVEWLTTG